MLNLYLKKEINEPHIFSNVKLLRINSFEFIKPFRILWNPLKVQLNLKSFKNTNQVMVHRIYIFNSLLNHHI